MPAPYNVSLLSNNTSPVTTVAAINDMSGGLFGAGILFMLYVVLFIIVDQGYVQGKIVLGISFVLSIVSGIMWMMEWLSPYYLAMNATMLVISIIIVIWGDN